MEGDRLDYGGNMSYDNLLNQRRQQQPKPHNNYRQGQGFSSESHEYRRDGGQHYQREGGYPYQHQPRENRGRGNGNVWSSSHQHHQNNLQQQQQQLRAGGGGTLQRQRNDKYQVAMQNARNGTYYKNRSASASGQLDLTSTFIQNLISIKFLVTHSLAGSFIGVGGASIKELMDISGARVSVSSHSDLYPGTSNRVLLITGSPNAVIFAACLVWDNFAIQVTNEQTGVLRVWRPRVSATPPSSKMNDDVEISARVTVPNNCAGYLIGRSGATIRSFGDESGAIVQINDKDEAVLTNERILEISGTKRACSDCLSLIVQKLSEGGPELYMYDEDHHMREAIAAAETGADSGIPGLRPDCGTRPPTSTTELSDAASGSGNGNIFDRTIRELIGGTQLDDEAPLSPGKPAHQSAHHGQNSAMNSTAGAGGQYMGGMGMKKGMGGLGQGRSQAGVTQGEGQGMWPQGISQGMTDGSAMPIPLAMSMNMPVGQDPYLSTLLEEELSDAVAQEERRGYEKYNQMDKGFPGGVGGLSASLGGIALGMGGYAGMEGMGGMGMSAPLGGPGEIGAIISANTTLNIAVPDECVGSIFGKGATVLYEIMNLSGANIVVSPRPPHGQFVEGTTTRVVTITGPPNCTNTAHMLIVQRLKLAQETGETDVVA